MMSGWPGIWPSVAAWALACSIPGAAELPDAEPVEADEFEESALEELELDEPQPATVNPTAATVIRLTGDSRRSHFEDFDLNALSFQQFTFACSLVRHGAATAQHGLTRTSGQLTTADRGPVIKPFPPTPSVTRRYRWVYTSANSSC